MFLAFFVTLGAFLLLAARIIEGLDRRDLLLSTDLFCDNFTILFIEATMSLGIAGTLIGVMLLRTLKNSVSTPSGPLLASLFPLKSTIGLWCKTLSARLITTTFA